MITAFQDRPISQPADHNGNGRNGSSRPASILSPAPREKQADVDIDLLRQYYQALYSRAANSGGMVCLWRSNSSSIFIEPGDIDRLIQCAVFSLNADQYNLVNLVDREAIDDIQERRGRGSEDDLHSIVALVADVDAAKPGSGKNYPPQAEIQRALRAMPLAPSIINLSGRSDGGVHAYWLFGEPIRIASRENVSHIKSVSRRWQQLLRDCLAPYDLDRTYDPPRVLRPAGTWNHKHGELVRPVVFRPDRLYDLADFEKHLPEEPLPPAPSPRKYFAIGAHDSSSLIERARRYLSKVPGAVAGQGGHGRTFSAACSLVLGFGLSPEDALPILTEWNQACVPPWSERELWHKLEDADTQTRERGYLLNWDRDRHGENQTAYGFKARLLDNGRVRFEWVGEDSPATSENVQSPAVSPQGTRTLDDFRQDMVAARVASLDVPGVYLDQSPTGAGKSHADILTARVAGRTLIILPTHRNCSEMVEDFQRLGLDAEAYPQLNEDTCGALVEAKKAIAAGLSPSSSVCLVCPLRSGCEYHEAMQWAESSANRLATHRRAELTFETLSEGRKYVAIHEDFVDVFSPTATASGGWETVAEIARHAKHKAWQRNDDTGQHFYHRMEEAAYWFRDILQAAEQTAVLTMPEPAGKPKHIDSDLWYVITILQAAPCGDAVKLCKSVAGGDLAELAVRVDQIFAPGREKKIAKSIIGTWRIKIPSNVPLWLCDATADPAEVEKLIGRPILNATPSGNIEQKHRIRQIPLDVKKTSSPGTAVAILRGVLAAFPEARRVGVITHQAHLPAIAGTSRKKPEHNLDHGCRQRISMVEHYHSGASRGSNQWLGECDLIVLLGTPRVPPSTIRERLIRTGRAEAASKPIDDRIWEAYTWTGKTESGQECEVECLGYKDAEWAAAYKSVVSAELRQAIGRGRAICENGIDVVAVTNEPLGFPIVDKDIFPIESHNISILQAIADLTGGETTVQEEAKLSDAFPKGADETSGEGLTAAAPIYIIGQPTLSNAAVTSSQIAAKVGKSCGRTIKNLNVLLDSGLVEKIGLRGGWRLSEAGLQFLCGGSVARKSAEEIPPEEILQRGEEGGHAS